MRVLRAAVWVARTLGRGPSRALVLPTCLVFLLACGPARAASAGYLARVLGRKPRRVDILRHFHTFGTTVLDRVYFLNDAVEQFSIAIQGEEIVRDILARGSGCLLLGAHHGSFEVLRLVGRRQPDLEVSLAMFEATGRKIGAALNAINPDAAPKLISLGTPGAMLAMRDCVERGGFVGMLADRTLPGDAATPRPFLGASAAFPTGPARLAELLGVPVVLMVGLFLGGNRYEIRFERITPTAEGDTADAGRLVDRYVARLEYYCRLAPYNWFNFYDFWA